jgi:hypothetical protein
MGGKKTQKYKKSTILTEILAKLVCDKSDKDENTEAIKLCLDG